MLLTFKNDTKRTKSMPRKTKTHISLTIDSGLLEWIDKQVGEFVFQSRSHGIEQAVYKLKKEMDKGKE